MHLVNAIGCQQVTCLCLLDLFAAVDAIDHSILLDRLSLWFGIHGTALNWFKSYLSDRLFCIKCYYDFSDAHQSCYGVPQGSINQSIHTYIAPCVASESEARTRSPVIYTLHYSSQLNYFVTVSQIPLVCWRHPVVYILSTRSVQRKHKISNPYKLLWVLLPTGWLPTFSASVARRLNFCY